MSDSLSLFPARIAIGQFSLDRRTNIKVHMTPEFYRALQGVLTRLGGGSSEVPDLDQIFFEAISAPAIQADQESAEMIAQTPQEQALSLVEVYGIPVIYESPEPPVYAPSHEGSALPFRSLDVDPSPMTIIAEARCAVHIDGAVDSLTYSRFGVGLTVSGSVIEMNQGDTLTIAYTSAPTLTLMPR